MGEVPICHYSYIFHSKLLWSHENMKQTRDSVQNYKNHTNLRSYPDESVYILYNLYLLYIFPLFPESIPFQTIGDNILRQTNHVYYKSHDPTDVFIPYNEWRWDKPGSSLLKNSSKLPLFIWSPNSSSTLCRSSATYYLSVLPNIFW